MEEQTSQNYYRHCSRGPSMLGIYSRVIRSDCRT